MKDIIINRTEDTPQVSFLLNGKFCIQGRAYSEDPRKFFDPLILWCRELAIDKIDLEVKLDYVNTASSKMVVDLLRTIDANTRISQKEIKWYFEEDDEDILETGQIIEETTLATSFYFLEMAEGKMSA
jgi:hypothetical protein